MCQINTPTAKTRVGFLNVVGKTKHNSLMFGPNQFDRFPSDYAMIVTAEGSSKVPKGRQIMFSSLQYMCVYVMVGRAAYAHRTVGTKHCFWCFGTSIN